MVRPTYTNVWFTAPLPFDVTHNHNSSVATQLLVYQQSEVLGGFVLVPAVSTVCVDTFGIVTNTPAH